MIQLRSVHQAPTWLPQWALMMEDLGNPPAARVAKVLGVPVSDIEAFNASGAAPRVVCLAVFWLTSWGQNAVHTQAHNDAVMLAGYVRGLRARVEALEGDVQHLLGVGDFGAANAPLLASGAPQAVRLPVAERGQGLVRRPS